MLTGYEKHTTPYDKQSTGINSLHSSVFYNVATPLPPPNPPPLLIQLGKFPYNSTCESVIYLSHVPLCSEYDCLQTIVRVTNSLLLAYRQQAWQQLGVTQLWVAQHCTARLYGLWKNMHLI